MEAKDARQTLGEAIRARRLALGWSQEKLADRVIARGDATFRQSDVSRLERGKVVLPHRERLEQIAAVLGLSPGELLARSGWTRQRDWPAGPSLPVHPVDCAPIAPSGPEAVDVSMPAARDMATPPSPEQSALRNPRLREALAQAHRTMARSERVLRQARAMQVIYEELPVSHQSTARSQVKG